jgi:hypothetical protein
MFFEGICQKCEAIVEYMSSSSKRDETRIHKDFEDGSACDGELVRVPFPRSFSVKWHYGKHDKKGCFMGPSKNVYKTDTTRKRDIAKTRTVSGPHYKGKKSKERQF